MCAEKIDLKNKLNTMDWVYGEKRRDPTAKRPLNAWRLTETVENTKDHFF